MKQRRIAMMAIALALAVSACAPKAGSTAQQTQTATVARGSLQATVSAAGTMAARAQVTVTFQNSGQVKTVGIKVGDRVKAGQVMASLDTTDLEISIATAQVSLESAQAKLAALKKGPLPSQIKAAEASLASAQAAYRAAQAKAAHAGDQVAIEQNDLDNAATRLREAQDSYNNLYEFPRSMHPRVYVPPAGQEWSSQKATLDNAQIDYQVAVANYKLAALNVNDNSVQQAAAQVASAQTNLDNLKNTPAVEDVQLAELAVKQAQVAVDQAKLNLTKSQLVAPFDGVVADVNIQPGQQTANTVNVIVADLSRLEAQVNVTESDLARIKVGQPVQATFDALTGQTFAGSVSKVAYVGTVSQGVVNYPVTIVLNQSGAGASSNAGGQIRPGMTASVSIVVEQRDNILLVPNRAVKLSGKQRVVTVLRDGKPEQVSVTLGMSNDSQSEITEGLNEGDTVVIQQTTTSTSQGGGGGMGPGFGGPPPGF